MMRPIVTLALSFALLLLPACDKRYQLETEAPAEAGVAEVSLSLDKTGNGEIEIVIEHLAPPAKIDSSLQAYVAWAQTGGQDPYKLGILKYDVKQRRGELDASYSATSFKLIITVEKDPDVDRPVGARILEARVAAPEK